MHTHFRCLTTLALLAGLAACSKSSDATPPPPGLVVTVTPASVVANGTNTVSVHVDGSTNGPISVSAAKGTFQGGTNPGTGRTSFPATPFDVALLTCDAANTSGCAGTVSIVATDASNGVGSAAVSFTGSGGGGNCTGCAGAACVGQVCDALGHTCSSAHTCTNCPGGGVEICNDGIDNDCDGLVDCDDPQCRPVGNNPGAVCDSNGHTCSPPINNLSTCSICSGNGGAPQAAEVSCGDGHDNDCDGVIDCQDSSCAGLTCNANGKTCDGATHLCVCNAPGAGGPGSEANGEATCDDGIDNNCNGLIDCKDSSCQPGPSGPGRQCGPHGQLCSSANGGSCVCAPNGNPALAQATETSCGDGLDNDCNGVVDCQDPHCQSTTPGALGLSCDAPGGATVGMKCTTSATCVCSGNGGVAQVSETSCGDHFDNDCNGLIDCADTACKPPAGGGLGLSCDANGNTCSAGGVCNLCAPNGNPALAQATETSCGDGVDNDCDGLVDCADANCLGQTCATNSICQNTAPAGQPPNVQCVNTVNLYSVTVVASSTRIAADGAATSTITATVKYQGTPVAAGRMVNFTQAGSGALLSAPSAATNPSGQATVTLTSDALGGTAVVTAADAATGQSAFVSIAMPQLGQVNLLSPTSGVLGVRYSGFQETRLLWFELRDTANQKYPPGLAVSFTHQSLGTSYIGASAANCTPGIPSVCTASGVTNADGQVSVLLTSGKSAGVVTVLATATGGGLTAQGTASNFAVVGAKASGAHITVACSPKNVPALTNDDCNFSHYSGPGNIITCTATFADRFNNVLGVSTLATFASEAGSAGPPATTPAYKPDQPPGGQTGLGIATDFISVNGGKLPVDVTPFTDEYRLTYGDDCGMLQHNPRDGLSTVVVMANGEEGFVDLNGNGVYDPGEPFIDMGEPFIDENDNGKRDNSEQFWDLNGNGTYDGPNGAWNANTVIWAETRVLYSGFPIVMTVANPAPPPATEEEASRFYDTGAPPDATPTPTWGTVQNPIYGSPGPLTTDTLGVVFMDRNFNAIIPAASYSVGPLGTGVVTARYTHLPTTVDNLGMSFTQQYCDSNPPPSAANGWIVTPTSCGNVCTTTPCYVVANVGNCDGTTCSGFSYGSWATAVITGSCNAPGADTVEATCTMNSVATPVDVSGYCYPCQQPQRYCGASCTNVQTDNNNCGTCGNRCGIAVTGQICSTGACQCPGSLPTVCSGACVNTLTDSNHCGNCTTICSGGQTCSGGICQ